jgi:hypothetical protein
MLFWVAAAGNAATAVFLVLIAYRAWLDGEDFACFALAGAGASLAAAGANCVSALGAT